jgi:sigma-E factor negative regulatory protein RseA
VTDQVKELISALMDGEASEIEIHRLLRQMKEDDSHREAWVTYQETRRILRAGAKPGRTGVHLDRQQHLELHQRISDAVAEDSAFVISPADEASSNTSTFSSMYKPAAGLAIAASLVVALFVGIQQEQPGTELAGDVSEPVGSFASQPSPIAAQPVSNELAREGDALNAEPELKELDAEGQKRLKAYLNQHDAMARIRQDTQFVNYSKQRGK